MTEVEEEEDKKAIPCKVVLIGESGVGKTSIISRYMHNTFSATVGSTPGANFTTKTIFLKEENQSIKYEIWDTAGQEKYRSLAKVFYKNASVCVLVYEITRRTSFDELKNFWINEVINNGASNISKKIFLIILLIYVVLAVAANKSDMYEYEEVPESEGMAFAKKYNAIFQTTSAKESNGSVDLLFQNIGKQILNPSKGNIRALSKDDLPGKGEQLKQEKMKKEKKGGCC